MDDAAKERFWSKVEKTDTCWLWTSAKQKEGYGLFWFDRKCEKAHRLSLEMALGRPITKGLVAAHAPLICRNPACVNPVHLREATHQENALDRFLDGTQSNRKGRLTDDEVRAIRSDPRVQRLIAEDYGIAEPTVSAIRTRRLYDRVV